MLSVTFLSSFKKDKQAGTYGYVLSGTWHGHQVRSMAPYILQGNNNKI